MEDLIDEVVDFVAESTSSFWENSDTIIEGTPDLIGDVSESAIYALADGNYNDAGLDFSDLFDTGEVEDSQFSSDETMGEAHISIEEQNDSNEVSFGSKYSDAEISKLKSDVDHAQSEVNARRNDVSNWESKVSLNDTKEHRANGDYAHAVSRLNEAKSRYNHAVDELNNAKRKLNSAT